MSQGTPIGVSASSAIVGAGFKNGDVQTPGSSGRCILSFLKRRLIWVRGLREPEGSETVGRLDGAGQDGY